MVTVAFDCGCAISYSMFGQRNIMGIHLCFDHQEELAEDLRAIVAKIPTPSAGEEEEDDC